MKRCQGLWRKPIRGISGKKFDWARWGFEETEWKVDFNSLTNVSTNPLISYLEKLRVLPRGRRMSLSGSDRRLNSLTERHGSHCMRYMELVRGLLS